MNRRDFLRFAMAAGGSSLLAPKLWAFQAISVENPLGVYPSRGWEQIYRDQYRYDSTFTWVCAPNDTHMCRLRAFVRNGVILRSEQNYDHDRCGDLYGNTATKAWNPRGCAKGYTMQRRVYGPYRLKGPVIRQGWKEWADAGFPSLSDDPELRTKYRFDDRGNDTFVRASWDEVSKYLAAGLEAIARTYSGDEGQARLVKDGYDALMIDKVEGAGTRTIKIGSNLPIHGVVGKFGIYRFANLLGLLDHHVRGVPPEEARGARDWNEYTWRGDQAPGQPFVHGLQTSDMDMNDLRFSKLVIQVGKNLIENKMPESHWLNEVMERGGKLVDIAPEYNCPATKSDYWIGVRPGLSDTAVFLGITKLMIDEGWYDADFVRRFTDFPLLVRTDTLKRLRPETVIDAYQPKDLSGGPSYSIQGLTDEQRARIGDFTVWDLKAKQIVAISRDEVGRLMTVEPALEGTFEVTLLDGSQVEVMPILEMYKRHLADYDLKTVEEISGASSALVRRAAEDIWNTTKAGQPVAIHIGEGINHYFHATLHNRATYLPLILTGNLGKHGAGVYTWAGNYKGALLQASRWSGPGAGSYVFEDPFNPVLEDNVRITHEQLRHCSDAEDPSYWACGEKVLALDTPDGRKLFTGRTHMPTPTKVVWYNNANWLNQAKWVYNLIVNVLPKTDLVIDQQIEWTGSAEYADVVLPVNSWPEFDDYECGASCSNPFLQVWKGGIKPVHDSRDDAEVFAGVARAMAERSGDQRFADYFKFVTEKRAKVYIQRVFDNCTTTRGADGAYDVDRLINGEYGGEPGAALMLFRTYPRVPFWEQVHDSIPFYTDCGRLCSYCDIPEAIEYGENLIVHREAIEATPYLPNVIVSSSPYVRPADYGIPLDTLDPDLRQVRNVKMSWSEVKRTLNPLWAQGFRFFCSTPKSRHSTHSSWSTVDWHWIWSDNFGDPYRADKRAPGVADRQIQMNPDAAAALGLHEGDYVYVDANPLDRPYVGWADDHGSFRHKAFRCLVRVKLNPGLPYNFTIMKHTGWIATERSVRAHETRRDGRALAADTGYQASYRYGSHQSITRGWMPPMHQTDTLFHKRTGAMAFVFGFDVDNHAINTVPKETLVKITKAEDGGIGGNGVWEPATRGYGPGVETPQNTLYLTGGYVKVFGKA
ncbi:MAG: molybdopterin-dependent oxidoreductase [Planctomycetes bacterium]|nr:molybdopterin-dependent oxidoreductase [Planctomycetota bacterium]